MPNLLDKNRLRKQLTRLWNIILMLEFNCIPAGWTK